MFNVKNIVIALLLIVIVIVVVVYFLAFKKEQSVMDNKSEVLLSEDLSVAYFAGGCFWCVEADLEKLSGVGDVVSGYMGGEEENPTYKDVSAHKTGHRESVKAYYDPVIVSYKDLVAYFFRHIDPTDTDGSFGDRGHQYTSAIYYSSLEEKEMVESVVRELEESKAFPKPIVTSIEPASQFWKAEEYHQNYYKVNPLRYRFYRSGSGRDDYIKSIWGEENKNMEMEKTNSNNDAVSNGEFWKNFVKPSQDELKKTL